jgi:hypothetical protein
MLQFRVYRKTENFHFLGGQTPFSQLLTGAIADVPPDYLPINFGGNRLENKNFSFLGVVRPLFPKFFTSDFKSIP